MHERTVRITASILRSQPARPMPRIGPFACLGGLRSGRKTPRRIRGNCARRNPAAEQQRGSAGGEGPHGKGNTRIRGGKRVRARPDQSLQCGEVWQKPLKGAEEWEIGRAWWRRRRRRRRRGIGAREVR
jgi:hypothetical protein